MCHAIGYRINFISMEIKITAASGQEGQQTFRTPSVFTDGSVFTVNSVNIVNLTVDGKVVTLSDNDPTPKGFVVFQTTLGQEVLHLSSLLKSRTGLDEAQKLRSFAPEGDFVAAAKAAIAALGVSPTLQQVRDALATALQGKQVRCTWRNFFGIAKDGRTYETHVRDFNFVA